MAPGPLSAGALAAAAAAAVMAIVVGRLGLVGVDLPAQVYRLRLFHTAGWTTWDPGWYGGHQVLGYSIMFEPVANAIGLYGVAALSAAAGAWCVHQLLAERWGRSAVIGTVVFTTGTIVPIAVGQMPFLLGQALGLLAVLAARRGRWWSTLLAIATPLASPVAGAFLLLAGAACLLGRARPRAVYAAMSGGAALSLAVVSVLNAQTGGFPFPAVQLLAILALCGLGVVLADRRDGVLRLGFLLYALASVVVFVIPNPLGGNVGRLGASFGAALAATVGWFGRRWLVGLLAVPLLIWQWAPASNVSRTVHDPSSQPPYYAGLLHYLDTTQTMGRVEIPLTARHWEAAFVAPHRALARGWERQLDIRDNAIFYQTAPLTPEAYHQWLFDAGVTLVALPDVALDHSSKEESRLLRSGLDYLDLAWADAHWTVWRVKDSPGLVSGPALLRSVQPGGFTLDATPGTVLVRLRYAEGWVVTQGAACVSRGPNDWTQITVLKAGTVAVSARVLPGSDLDC